MQQSPRQFNAPVGNQPNPNQLANGPLNELQGSALRQLTLDAQLTEMLVLQAANNALYSSARRSRIPTLIGIVFQYAILSLSVLLLAVTLLVLSGIVYSPVSLLPSLG